MKEKLFIRMVDILVFFFLVTAAEQELAKLQRQYRIIEGDRRAYSEETQNYLRKQRYMSLYASCC